MRLKIKKPFILWNESRGAAASRGLPAKPLPAGGYWTWNELKTDSVLFFSLLLFSFFDFCTHSSYVFFTHFFLLLIGYRWPRRREFQFIERDDKYQEKQRI